MAELPNFARNGLGRDQHTFFKSYHTHLYRVLHEPQFQILISYFKKFIRFSDQYYTGLWTWYIHNNIDYVRGFKLLFYFETML